ncbi:hypothetical protein [Hydrogenophaga sp. PAMC20947]|uniref:hypothetical protein n=1 Tax=Hydrogenophaga sp. PAMC20947 TaxID=2565558 RepID=UPI001B348C35
MAIDLCAALDPFRESAPGATAGLGVAVSMYHVRRDPKLQTQIARAGRNQLLAFHLCDWLTPTTDLLNDRRMIGDGIIDSRRPAAGLWTWGLLAAVS